MMTICILCCCFCFNRILFFFKQKTAYDMRISDWSSDVCSSDLDLYFGEWSQTGSATAGDHTVYYGGTGATSSGNMPSSGSANYTVKGISNYASSGTPLSGTFTANFGAGELTGSIQNSALKIDIGTADILDPRLPALGPPIRN